MLLDLNISLSDDDIIFLNNSKNKRALLLRVKKITSLYAGNILKYVEYNCDLSSLKRCRFCNNIKDFGYTFVIEQDRLFLDYTYPDDFNVCRRTDTNCISKKLNPNSKEYVKVVYGFNTIEEAHEYILKRNKSPFYRTNYSSDEEYKNAQRRDVVFYGSEEKFREVCDRISKSSSKDGMIEKYGEERVKEIYKSKDSSSKEFAKQKYGNDWEKYYYKKIEECTHTINNRIKRYGLDLGTQKHNEFTANAKLKGRENADKLSPGERSLIFDTSSKEYFKRKYPETWEEEYFNKLRKSSVKCSKASKESLKFFNKLLTKIQHLEYKFYIGVDGSEEYFIYDSENKKYNLFDFCIRELKIIVEYHGSLWHFNENFTYKRKLPFNLNIDDMKIRDSYKKELAESNGFDYYVVFDTDNFDEKAEEISKIIIKKDQNERSI